MNDYGDVVGITDHHQGFVWKWSGEYQTFDPDGGVAFAGINDRREIAGTITHVADPERPYDGDGVTGALLKDGHDPVYTGDQVIQSLADYKNPEYRQHHVASNAGAINERGSIGLVMARESVGRPACLWHRKETLRCSEGIRRRSMIIGVDGQDRLVFAEDTSAQASFVLLPDGPTWYLNDIVDQSSIRPLGARGVSESGFVVGYVTRRETGSFILTPMDGAR